MNLRAAIAGFALAFGVVSILDVLLTLVTAALGWHTPATALAIVGLWLALGGLTGAAVWILMRLSLGPVDARLAALARWWLRWWLRDDRRPTAALFAISTGVLGWAATSWFAVRWLIVHKHGAGLIATASVGLVLAALVAGAGLGAASWRIYTRLPLPSLRVTVRALAVVLAVAGVAAAWLGWGALVTVGGVPIVLFVLALALAAAPFGVRAGVRRAWLLPLAGVAMALAGARSMPTRGDLAAHAWLARQLFTRLVLLSDFDRDGEPWLLSGRDCAPFDAAIHPHAPGAPGNGIDEDCDGADDEQPPPPLPIATVAPVETPPSLLLITIDSVRTERLGLYGGGTTSPALDAWAAGAAVFDRAWSADSGTAPSLWSLMVGKTPFQVHLEMHAKFPPRYAATERTLASRLSEAGYTTEAVLCGRVLGRAHWNLRDGFDRYVELCGRTRTSRQAERVTTFARKRLNRLRTRARPFFMWVHYFDPHRPYHDHDDLELDTPYDEELRYTDTHLAPLLRHADWVAGKRPLWVAVTADHGENFDEHGHAPHARNLYRQVTRVPLLVRGPGVVPRRIGAPVCSNDLFPTFLGLAGLSAPTSMRSLLPVLRGADPDPTRLVFQENSFARPLRHTRAVVGATHHLILDQTTDRVELYDLEADWDERHDLAGTGLSIEQTLRDALTTRLRTIRLPPELAR